MREDLSGKTFSSWFVLWHVSGPDWRCVCDCGTRKTVRSGHLKNGASKSCGCQNRGWANRRHGMTRTPEHKTWVNIRERCSNPKHISFKWYGAKGVKVCERWQTFENFFADMGKRPSKQHSIDRFPNKDGNYEPGNCRWALSVDQANNRRCSKRYAYNGDSLTPSEWERKLGFPRSIVSNRLRSGWTLEMALTKAVAV